MKNPFHPLLVFALITALCLCGAATASFAKVGTTQNKKETSQATRLQISTQGSQLAFDQTVLHARAGQSVELTFTNRADPDTGLRHLWVLVKPGTAEKVATAGVEAGAARGYIPDSPDVIAHTRLLKPGESQTIRFRAPYQPGDYPYLCTYPGHSQVLRGILKVEK